MAGDAMVMLEQCYDDTHAQIVRGLLEANDIPCVLVGENHHRMESYLSVALGGIRIMVRRQDMERAQDLLNIPSAEHTTAEKKSALQKPYWRSVLLGLVGLFMGAPVMRAKGKHQP